MRLCKKILGISAAIFVITAGTAVPVQAATGPGVNADSASYNPGEVRDYPGFNGSGPSLNDPVEGCYSDDGWDDLDDDDSGPWFDSYARGWRYNPNGWWYQYGDGTWPANQWKYIDARWYLFGQSGHMVTGWYSDGSNRFYLNPVDDGTLGSMRTGWQMIDGKAYYFNTMSDGSLGRLLVNTTTPDGYKVGADGALLP